MNPSATPGDRGSGIALVGYRASGKTTVALRLARALGRPVFDVDQEIERNAGRTISSLFRDEGEAVFRDIEERVLSDLVRDHPGAILSTGGGIVLRAANRRVLRDFGQVIWLKAPVATLIERLRSDPADRPSLTGAGLIEEVQSVLLAREPLYQEVSDFTIDASLQHPDQVTRNLLQRLSLEESRR